MMEAHEVTGTYIFRSQMSIETVPKVVVKLGFGEGERKNVIQWGKRVP